jgi:outer membrane protease
MMNHSEKVIRKILVLFLLCSNCVFSADNDPIVAIENTGTNQVSFDVSVGTELMAGNTTYSIGYPITVLGGETFNGYFPFSELEWPLDIWLARIDAGINIGSSWKINGTLEKNLSDPDSPMIDQDWFTPGQLDVYSESSISDFNALILDFDVEWMFLRYKSLNFYAGLGYQYQNFQYDGNLIYQYSPSGEPGFNAYGNGRVGITYEITYKMPYLLIGGEYQVASDFIIKGNIRFSPLVDAEDDDNHILRDNTSKGSMDGSAYMIDVSGIYSFLSPWFVEAGFYYSKIDVTGDQIQSFSGVPEAIVYEASESIQISGYLNVGYKF